MNNKLIILGKHERTTPDFKQMTIDDPDWMKDYDIWGINDGFGKASHIPFTHWFEIHDPSNYDVTEARQLRWMQNTNLPLYAHQKMLDALRMKNGRLFPYAEIMHKLDTSYFTSTIAWLMGFALSREKYKRIDVLGVDMKHATEYEQQRPCMEYWIGYGKGLGIDVRIPPTSTLLGDGMLYGLGIHESSMPRLDADTVRSL